MTDIVLGDLRLTGSGPAAPIAGESHRRTKELTATVETFTVTAPEWEVILALRRWSNGDEDVCLHERGDAPQSFDRLRTKCRMGIFREKHDLCWMELGQARIGDGEQPALRRATIDELNLGAGCDVAQTLCDVGATAVGTRADARGDTGIRRLWMCVEFPATAINVPLAAYALTRLAPLRMGLEA